MDWEQLAEKTLGEEATALVAEGAGVAGGFVLAAFGGRQIQNFVKKDADINNFTDMAMAWGGNNLPKLLVWYLTRGYAVKAGETVTPGKEFVSDGRKAIAGSVVFDTLMRFGNGGKNPANVTIGGWQILGEPEPVKALNQGQQGDVQRLLQENGALRTELNKALQRLASQPTAPTIQQPMQQTMGRPGMSPMGQPMGAAPVVQYTPVVPYSAVPPYGTPIPPYSAPPAGTPGGVVAQPTPPAVQERQRRFGAMQPPPGTPVEMEPPAEIIVQTPPAVQERQRRFGAMQPPQVQERQKKFSFMAGEERDIASAFGML